MNRCGRPSILETAGNEIVDWVQLFAVKKASINHSIRDLVFVPLKTDRLSNNKIDDPLDLLKAIELSLDKVVMDYSTFQ